jgi:hypothetical protein
MIIPLEKKRFKLFQRQLKLLLLKDMMVPQEEKNTFLKEVTTL